MDSYKIFRQLQEREKRANPYKFYDKDELIDEILKLEDKIEQIRDMLYKRQLDDYDIYTANVVCDFQSDFEEILRGD